jgi:hypothetical protein
MRAVKTRLLECLPTCRTFLDVDGNCCWGRTRDRNTLQYSPKWSHKGRACTRVQISNPALA